MKKLLSLLATVSLVSTSTASIVACGNGNNGPIDEDIKQDISTIISVTELGDINFYSLTGNDVQTRTEIIDQVRTLNSNVGDAQINISNINQLNSTATISVVGFNGALTVTFTPLHASEIEPILPISFPSTPRSMIQLQDGTILVAGSFFSDGSTSFLASVDLSNTTNPVQTLAQGSTVFPSILRMIVQLEDGTILAIGGFNAETSFLASVDLSNPTNPVQTLAQGLEIFPSSPVSITQLQDGTIFAVGGNVAGNLDPFIASVDLSNPTSPQTQILAQDSFPSSPNSMIELQNGTILVTGGNVAGNLDPFIASVDLSNTTNPVQTLAQGLEIVPSTPQSITQLQDGTILVSGGTNAETSFLSLVDLSDLDNPQIQTLAQGPSAFPSVPRSITQLQDGTILVAGGNNANGSDSFLRVI